MAGLGTQDDLALAREFVDETGISSFPMLWDETFDSWSQLGVASQPAWGLFTASGEFLQGGFGEIDADAVLETVASIPAAAPAAADAPAPPPEPPPPADPPPALEPPSPAESPPPEPQPAPAPPPADPPPAPEPPPSAESPPPEPAPPPADPPPPPETPPPPPEAPPPPPDPPQPPPDPPPPPPTTRVVGPNDLPASTVVDVFSGEDVVLASFAPADRPIFVWVWAPH